MTRGEEWERTKTPDPFFRYSWSYWCVPSALVAFVTVLLESAHSRDAIRLLPYFTYAVRQDAYDPAQFRIGTPAVWQFEGGGRVRGTVHLHILALCITPSLGAKGLADTPVAGSAETADTQRGGYSSPQEVFAAYRTALSREDWRTAFHCLTRPCQDFFIFEIAFAAGMHEDRNEEGKALNAALQRYGYDPGELEAAFEAAFGDKKPIDIDVTAMHKLMGDLVKDRETLFVEAHRILAKYLKGKPSVLHSLMQIEVHGKEAVGRSRKTSYVHSVYTNGGEMREFVHKVTGPAIVHFRKCDGKWFFHRIN